MPTSACTRMHNYNYDDLHNYLKLGIVSLTAGASSNLGEASLNENSETTCDHSVVERKQGILVLLFFACYGKSD